MKDFSDRANSLVILLQRQYLWNGNRGGEGNALCFGAVRLTCPNPTPAKQVSPHGHGHKEHSCFPHTHFQSFVTSVIYKSNHSKLSFCFLRLESGPKIPYTAWASCFLREAQSLHRVSCTVNAQRTSAGSREHHSKLSFAVTGSPYWEGWQEEEALFSRRNVGREGGFQ